jgi:hypothetical protein
LAWWLLTRRFLKFQRNLKQTWHEWFFGGKLSKLCPVTPTSIHDGCHEQIYFFLHRTLWDLNSNLDEAIKCHLTPVVSTQKILRYNLTPFDIMER